MADPSRPPVGRPDLTIVIPALNEAARLPASLPRLVEHLATRPGVSEVIVVDDGSSDGTERVARDLVASLPVAEVLRLDRHVGKGAAVRAGVARATGDRIVFMDADLATDLAHLDPVIRALDDAHVVLGSRGAPGAVTTGFSPSGALAHRGFGRLARMATGLPVVDFQCGFKAFRAPAAKLLFHLLREPGYAFDVELLATAGRLGYRIREVPVSWHAMHGSHVRLLPDAASMAVQLARIRRRSSRDLPRGRSVPDGGRAVPAIEVTAGAGLVPTGAADGRAGVSTDAVEARLRAVLPGWAPIAAGDGRVLALLPFVAPEEVELLVKVLDRASAGEGIEVRRAVVAEADLLGPGPRAQSLRAALAGTGNR